ncbi:MAG: NAD(P)/FAD-dependent oxidoreductase [Geminicoccaceae bacterium]|nr:NAD(P)/FAD-dependent oxidoreductase [Geminicoccaceae bacterium]
MSKRQNGGLAALESRLHEDLVWLCQPPSNWVPERWRDDERIVDVVIIGGGMCGMVAWHALNAGGVRNMRVFDSAEEGFEGPWLTYARMETLRSPKQLTGPAFGHGALTFQAWYRATFGDASWDALDKIPRPMWMDYLRWYRKVLGVPVENGVTLDRVTGDGDLLRLEIRDPERRVIHARKLVMATGRDGTGHPSIPAFMDGVPAHSWAHTSDDIDFKALRGRRVAVIGIGASAVDNAAEALEAGAAEVRHLIRRTEMPTINKLMGIGSFGFTAGYADLPDAWRWRIMNYSFRTQTPSPRGSTLRVSRHPNAFFHFAKATTSVEEEGDGLRIGFADGTSIMTDFLILGTGFTVDPMARREFGEAAGQIRLWKDAYTPPEGEENRDLGYFPYLAPDFTFRERVTGQAPWLSNVYCFNYGATASLGKVSGDIPGVSEGAEWLARAIASKLYAEDIDRHWQALLDYARPELQGDEWRVDPLPDPDTTDDTGKETRRDVA